MKVLTELLQELHNWFVLEMRFGTITISNGSITIDGADTGLLNKQYFRIIGSVFNDGVYKFGTDKLDDETFSGALWYLGIPKAVINLAEEIDAWKAKYEDVDSAAMSPFNSESFGGYSYAKGGAGVSTSTGAVGWKGVFASRLNRWRKI